MNGNIIEFKKMIEGEVVGEYQTINSFSNNRRTIKESYELLNLYVDLDVYNVDYLVDEIQNFIKGNLGSEYDFDWTNEDYNKVHQFLIKKITRVIEKNNLPFPTQINFSGRGYHVLWSIQTVNEFNELGKKVYGANAGNQNIKTLYNKIQGYLVDCFKELGSDHNCKDIARVLRRENTLNHKSNLKCSVIYENEKKYKLEEFANLIFKYTYKEVIEYKKQSATHKQLELLESLGVEFDASVTIEGAKKLISEEIKKRNEKRQQKMQYGNSKGNKQWFVNYLEEILDKDLIKASTLNKSGNRNQFIFLYGIASKHAHIDQELAKGKLISLLERKGLNTFLENESSFISGYSTKSCLINSKTAILKRLNISGKEIPKKRKRTLRKTNKEIKNAYNKMLVNKKIILLKNVKGDYIISCRKLAKKYKLSKDSANKIRKEIKLSIKEKVDHLTPKNKALSELINIYNICEGGNTNYNNIYIVGNFSSTKKGEII